MIKLHCGFICIFLCSRLFSLQSEFIYGLIKSPSFRHSGRLAGWTTIYRLLCKNYVFTYQVRRATCVTAHNAPIYLSVSLIYQFSVPLIIPKFIIAITCFVIIFPRPEFLIIIQRAADRSICNPSLHHQ